MKSPSLRWPLILVLLSIAFGTGLGAAFGIWEDRFKGYLESRLEQNEKLSGLAPELREKEAKALQDKAWQYFKRAHLHAGGIAALSLGLLLLLRFLQAPGPLKTLFAYLLAVGGLLYPLFWLAAGMEAPALGTSAAKEKFQLLAGGGFLHLAGTLGTLGLLLRRQVWERPD